MAAMSVKGLPHWGQAAMSIANTRLSNWAQLMRARPSFALDLGKEGLDVFLDALAQRGLFGTPVLVESLRATLRRLDHCPVGRGLQLSIQLFSKRFLVSASRLISK